MILLEQKDAIRQLIKERAKAQRKPLARLSKAIGKNHSYLQQFIERGVPQSLPEKQRYALAEALDLDESELRDPTIRTGPPAVLPKRKELGMNDGERIDPGAAPKAVAEALASFLRSASTEAWRIITDMIEAAGYLPGDFVVVDLKRQPTAGDVVLAEIIDDRRREVVFRISAPPYLLAASHARRAMAMKPILVDNDRVIIKGVVVGSIRAV
jgi:hypothetical protein